MPLRRKKIIKIKNQKRRHLAQGQGFEKLVKKGAQVREAFSKFENRKPDPKFFENNKQKCQKPKPVRYRELANRSITSVERNFPKGFLAQSFLSLFRNSYFLHLTRKALRKVVLWVFFMSETSEKIHNSTFRVKISVQNLIFSIDMGEVIKIGHLIFHRIW